MGLDIAGCRCCRELSGVARGCPYIVCMGAHSQVSALAAAFAAPVVGAGAATAGTAATAPAAAATGATTAAAPCAVSTNGWVQLLLPLLVRSTW